MLPLQDMGLGLPKPCAAPGLCSPWCGATTVLQFPVTALLCPSLRPPLPPPGPIFHRQGRTCSCCEDKVVPCCTDKGASHPLSPPPAPPATGDCSVGGPRLSAPGLKRCGYGAAPAT